MNVPAVSTNTPVNSIVQMIHGCEIGLKKSHTDTLNYQLWAMKFDAVPKNRYHQFESSVCRFYYAEHRESSEEE